MKAQTLVPRINANDNKAEIVAWSATNKSQVRKGQPIAELGTSKAIVTVEAEESGYILHMSPVGSLVQVNQPLCKYFDDLQNLEESAKTQTSSLSKVGASLASAVTPQGTHGISGVSYVAKPQKTFSFYRLTPAAQAYAQANGLHAELFAGMGLVTLKRLEEKFAVGRDANDASAEVFENQPERCPVQTPTSSADTAMRAERVPIAKRAEIEALQLGAQGLINSCLTMQFMSDQLRLALKRTKAFNGQILPVILYELGRLLPQYPKFTSYFENGEIRFFDRTDIGVAIDLGAGLKVITIRDADRLLPNEIYLRLIDASLKYMNNELPAELLQGSTITVTDLSAAKILSFHPLINGKQAVIIGIGGDNEMPGQPMTLNITFDHRILAGREVAEFMAELRERILQYAITDGCVGAHA